MILVMKVRCLTVWQMQYFAVMTGIKVIPDFTRHRSGLTRLLENDPEIEGDIRKVFEGFGASIVPYPVTERWLSYIREKWNENVLSVQLSDEMYCQSEEQLSFLKTFDGGVFSWKEKCMKPDPKIYEILLKRYKIVPEQALFFDDRLENVEGARKVGINGAVFNTDIPLQMLEK